MSFEDRLISGIDRRRGQEKKRAEYLDPAVREALPRAEKFIQEYALSPEDFRGTYGDDVVDRDIAETARLEKKFYTDEAHKKYAEVMEAILCEQIEQSDWFGSEAATIKTSLYDDYTNGVDIVVEFENATRGLSHLGLAVDVTFGKDSIEKKFQRIRGEIQKGRLAEIKYFESENGRYKGTLQKLPRVIVGMERGMVIELAKMWIGSSSRTFGGHPVQKMLLTQIVEQLEYFRRYAKSYDQKDLVEVFSDEINVVQAILDTKKDIAMDSMKEDGIFLEIQQQLKRL